MRPSFEQFQDMMTRLYPDIHKRDIADPTKRKLARTVTFQVTEACNLKCSYCYQINKGKKKMSFETAKKLIDLMLDEDPKLNGYLNVEDSPSIVIEFIGGEPLLEIELIEQICDYFFEEAIKRCHPWATKVCISITTNGVLYFTPKVQHFLQKYRHFISFSVTLDGNKELHDMCRRFPNGDPSYDLAEAACKDWMNKGFYMGSKVTLAPENVNYFYDAILNMINLGYHDILANPVYEEGWQQEHATILYDQCIKVADYILDNNLEYSVYCSIFEDNIGVAMDEDDNDNWCGGTDLMLAMDPDGYLYPCLRYMKTSVGEDVEPIILGHVDTGIAIAPKEQQTLKCLHCINRRSQSTDECYYCPIAKGCGWCSAYNYQVTGSADKRVTFTCELHKARCLANTYFWNKYFQKINAPVRMKVNCPKDWALNIISEGEYNKLLQMAELEG